MSTETTASRFDGLKWAIVFALIGAAVVGNSYYADQSLLYRVLGILALGIVAGLVALQTAKGAAFWALVKGSRTEIRKVVWPTKQETTQTAIAVFVFTLVMMLFFWILDSGLLWLTRRFVG